LDYISCGVEDKSRIAFANALEIAEQYRVKERMIRYFFKLTIESKMATEIAFKPFKPLRSEGNHLEDRIERIRTMIAQREYEEAIDASTELMTVTLAGFRYLQTCRFVEKVLIIVTIGFS